MHFHAMSNTKLLNTLLPKLLIIITAVFSLSGCTSFLIGACIMSAAHNVSSGRFDTYSNRYNC